VWSGGKVFALRVLWALRSSAARAAHRDQGRSYICCNVAIPEKEALSVLLACRDLEVGVDARCTKARNVVAMRRAGGARSHRRCISSGGLFSNPNRIPMGVVSDSGNQSCPYRIGNDVAGGFEYIFVKTQGAVVITRLPDRSSPRANFAQSMA
jgi:hypothetical protein